MLGMRALTKKTSVGTRKRVKTSGHVKEGLSDNSKKAGSNHKLGADSFGTALLCRSSKRRD